MVDMGAIAAAVSSLKTATDIARGLVDLKSTAEIQGKVIELQGVILDAQSSALAAQSDQFTLLERARELERRVTEIEAWEAQKRRYQLTDFGGGTFAFVLREDKSDGEPPHRLCAACFQQDRKSILQFQYRTNTNQDKYTCPSCKTDFAFGVRSSPPRPVRMRSSIV